MNQTGSLSMPEPTLLTGYVQCVAGDLNRYIGSDAKLSNRFDDEFVSYFSMINADDCLGLMV